MHPPAMILVTILLVLGAQGAQGEPLQIHNPATPPDGVVQMQLTEQWRVGGPDDEENFFGLVTWAETDAAGLLYVLDVQMCQVLVYDQEGALVKTLFHEGDGPGEIRQPRDLVLLPDGTIGAVQEFPGKITKVDGAGNPAGTITPGSGDPAAGGFMALTAAEHRGGTFLVSGVSITPGERQGTQVRRNYLATIDDAGVLQETVLESRVDWDFTNFAYIEDEALPSFFWGNAVGPKGRIYAVPERDAYRINVYAPDGTLERVFGREYESWHRTAADRKWLTALFEGAFRNLPFELDLRLSEYEADISWLNRGLQVTDDGEIWVLPSRGTREQPAGVVATFDVFDPEGQFSRQVQVVCPEGDPARDGIFLLGTDRVLLIKGYVDATATMFGGAGSEDAEGDADPMELICYRIGH